VRQNQLTPDGAALAKSAFATVFIDEKRAFSDAVPRSMPRKTHEDSYKNKRKNRVATGLPATGAALRQTRLCGATDNHHNHAWHLRTPDSATQIVLRPPAVASLRQTRY